MSIEEIKKAIKDSEKYNIWENPKRNWNLQTNSGDCEYCGKKCGKNSLYVHIATDGTCLPNGIDEDMVNSTGEYTSQGSFAIGSSCAKKLFGKDIDKYTFSY